MIETNPGPGLVILLAYMMAGKGTAQESAVAFNYFFGHSATGMPAVFCG